MPRNAVARPDPAAGVLWNRVRSLPRRFRSDSANGLVAEWELQLGSLVFAVGVNAHRCSVREGPALSPQATIWAEPATWLAIDEGRLTPTEAFFRQRLRVTGNIDLAVRVQTLFRPFRRTRRPEDLDHVEIEAGGLALSCYRVGAGEPMVLLHGLGGSKISWLPVIDSLADRYRVIAPDLPGHGESAKPVAEYGPRFYARAVRRLMDEEAFDRAWLVGNSMGGRVALELALRSPARVAGMVLLGPAMPGMRWRYLLNVTRVIPTGVGSIPFPLRERWMRAMVRRLFARPDQMSPETFAVAAGEFIRVYRDPRARMAFFSSLRRIVTERPDTFWASMRRVRQPTLVVVGEEDRMVPPGLGAKLADHLFDATLLSLPAIGHVPQVEAAEETLEAIRSFLGERSAGGPEGYGC